MPSKLAPCLAKALVEGNGTAEINGLKIRLIDPETELEKLTREELIEEVKEAWRMISEQEDRIFKLEHFIETKLSTD